jgi:hypothetical protein
MDFFEIKLTKKHHIISRLKMMWCSEKKDKKVLFQLIFIDDKNGLINGNIC